MNGPGGLAGLTGGVSLVRLSPYKTGSVITMPSTCDVPSGVHASHTMVHSQVIGRRGKGAD